MVRTEKFIDNGKERDPVDDLVSSKGGQPSSGNRRSPGCIIPMEKNVEGKDDVAYANILRKFVDALAIYENVLEKDFKNAEAHIGKGICLQMQNKGRLAQESFSEAIKLEPQNACALTLSHIVVFCIKTRAAWWRRLSYACSSTIAAIM